MSNPGAQPPPDWKRILVVRLDAIGDYVLFRNTLRFLRESEPFRSAHLAVLGNPAWRSLAEAYDADAADEWIWAENRTDLFRKSHENLMPGFVWRRRVARAQSALRERIVAGNYNVVVSPQSTRDPLLDQLLRGTAPEVVGVANPGRADIDDSAYTRLVNPGDDAFVFDRNRRVAGALAHRRCDVPLSLPARSERAVGEQLKVVFFLGASHWTKRWPCHNWCALASRLLANYRFATLRLCGGKADRARAARLVRSLPDADARFRVKILAGEQSLSELAETIAGASVIVTNDTCALHIAAAADTPCIAIVNGETGRGGFWPYPAKLKPAVTVVQPVPRFRTGTLSNVPGLGLLLSQRRQYRDLAGIGVPHVWSILNGACIKALKGT